MERERKRRHNFQATEKNLTTDDELKVLKYRQKKSTLEKEQNIVNELDKYDDHSLLFQSEVNVLSSLMYLSNNREQTGLVNQSLQYINQDMFLDVVNREIYKLMIDRFKLFITGQLPTQEQHLININELNNTLVSYENSNDVKQNTIYNIYKERHAEQYLKYLFEKEDDIYNLVDYSKELSNNYKRHTLIQKLIHFANHLNLNNQEEFQNNFNQIKEEISNIIEDNNDKELSSLEQISDDFINKVNDVYHGVSDQDTLDLGEFVNLSDILKIKGGNMISIGARPSVGKTTFALNLIYQTLNNDQHFKDRKPVVAMFSLEMSREELINKYASILTSIPMADINSGKLNNNQIRSLMLFAQEDVKNFYVNDNSAITIDEIENQLINLKQNHEGHLDLVVIDYLQLMNSQSGYGDNRQQQISTISRNIKIMARKLNVPIIAIVQLSRNLENRMDKRPILSDIRESGSIEQDSDAVLFLYRDDYYETNNNNEDNHNASDDGSLSQVDVIVAKNRAGKRGTVKFIFDKPRSQFAETTGIEIKENKKD